jgi:hypothetical protein
VTDDKIKEAAMAAGVYHPDGVRLFHDVGPYEITEPTHAMRQLVEAIEKRAQHSGCFCPHCNPST